MSFVGKQESSCSVIKCCILQPTLERDGMKCKNILWVLLKCFSLGQQNRNISRTLLRLQDLTTLYLLQSVLNTVCYIRNSDWLSWGVLLNNCIKEGQIKSRQTYSFIILHFFSLYVDFVQFPHKILKEWIFDMTALKSVWKSCWPCIWAKVNYPLSKVFIWPLVL